MKPLTKIKFNETGDKFTLTQTADGFDAVAVKFTKNAQPEHWTFQELLEKFRSGEIAFEGFAPEENNLVESYLQNLIHQTEIANLSLRITGFSEENEKMKIENDNLQKEISDLKAEITSLKSEVEEGKQANDLLRETKELAQQS